MSVELEAVVRARAGQDPIELSRVLLWMNSDDLEVLGATFHSITAPKFWERIRPAPSFEQCQRFARGYFERCLREDPTGAWCDSRYTAGHAIIAWLRDLPRWGEQGASALAEWKEFLAGLYRTGDGQLRTALVTATLEHLFEDPKMARYFADWRSDPVLREAYDDSLEWSHRGGDIREGG